MIKIETCHQHQEECSQYAVLPFTELQNFHFYKTKKLKPFTRQDH